MPKPAKISIILAITAAAMVGLSSCNGKKVIPVASMGKDIAEEVDPMSKEQQAVYEKVLRLIKKAKSENLIELDLRNLRLSKLPREFDGLFPSHKIRLAKLPPEIGQLTKLQKLYIDYNCLSSLPPEIGKLSSLKILSLQYNKLTSLPESMGGLSNLQYLNLGGNQLSSLPQSLGKLSNLQELLLFSNQLEALPVSMGNLSHLEKLWLQNNQLNKLPQSIIQLDMDIICKREYSDKGINLYGNPLEEPPVEVVKQGKAAVKAYFAEQDK